MSERVNNLENFIGVYDNYVPKVMCETLIKFFEKKDDFKQFYNRLDSEGTTLNFKKDVSTEIFYQNYMTWANQCPEMKSIILNFDSALKEYEKQTDILSAYAIKDFDYTALKIQKTEPSGGYHLWHTEHGADYVSSARALAFIIYLNDIEEGGETEFLHFSKRVTPKAGRIVIWPSGFPYVHRGNPPLKETKYILTSWMMLPGRIC